MDGYAWPISGAAPKVKELVGEVLSSTQVEKLERCEREKNDREDVKEAVDKLTAMAKQRLKCAPMLSGLLEKVLPKWNGKTRQQGYKLK